MIETNPNQPSNTPETDDESTMKQLRSKAAELLLTENWAESIQKYTQIISLCNQKWPKESIYIKALCLAHSNRAEARLRLREYEAALSDCDEALKIEALDSKALLCKGKVLMNLGRYLSALDCFKSGLCGDDLIQRCRKLEYMSRSGNFDVSEWVLGGFSDKCRHELCEFVGCVEIKKSEISGRGLFCTKNVDVGGLILVSKATVVERCILPGKGFGEVLGENAQMLIWKSFVSKVIGAAAKCGRTRDLIGMLSTGENEDELEVPVDGLFKNDEGLGGRVLSEGGVEMEKMLSVLDVNSLVEDAVSSKVLGKNRDYYGLGLWLLPSFINHSCVPNVRRVHIGDYVVVLASRDIKAGEEVTFAYYDVLSPLNKRKEMAKAWGFTCRCKRCKHEEQMQSKPEFNEIELGLEKGVVDAGCTVFRLEECMRKSAIRGKDKGYLRASFWKAFSEAYESEKMVRRWGRKIPALEPVVESLVEAVGSDERVVKVLVRKMKKCGGSGSRGFGEMERALKLGRGVYGKIMRKQALKILLEIGVHD
ncbi:hypothetical protein vseg_002030 [Gypsophila vaccaria]